MFKEKFKQFLELSGLDFHRLNRSGWQSFEIEHGNPKIKKDNYRLIDSKVGKKNGVYVYKKDGRILYVGKGNPLVNRLKDHNRKSFEPVPRDTKNKMWYRFFSKNKGRLKIFWKEIEPEDERVILEKMLEYINPSEFMDYKNRNKNKK